MENHQNKKVILFTSFGAATGAAVGAIIGDVGLWVGLGVSLGCALGFITIRKSAPATEK